MHHMDMIMVVGVVAMAWGRRAAVTVAAIVVGLVVVMAVSPVVAMAVGPVMVTAVDPVVVTVVGPVSPVVAMAVGPVVVTAAALLPFRVAADTAAAAIMVEGVLCTIPHRRRYTGVHKVEPGILLSRALSTRL